MCPWEKCSEECVAYNVTCIARRLEGYWVSEGQLMNRLFSNASLNHHWVYLPGTVSVSVVFFSLLLLLLFIYMIGYYIHTHVIIVYIKLRDRIIFFNTESTKHTNETRTK